MQVFCAEVLRCEFSMGIGFPQQRFRAVQSIERAQKVHISWMSKCFRSVTSGRSEAFANLTDAGVGNHSGL